MMNSYERKATEDLKHLLQLHGYEVSEDCFCDLLDYVTAETRRSFLSGLKKQRCQSGRYKTALEGGRLQAVEQSG